MSMGHMVWRVLSIILCNPDPKVKVKSEKLVFLMVYYRLHSSCVYTYIILIVFCVQDVMTDETADSDAQAHQELHCLSMWKK